MARPRSEFLGSLGKLFSIFKKVADAVLELGGSDDDIIRINTDEVLATNIAYLLLASRTRGDLRGGFGGTLVAVRNPLTGDLIRVGEPFYVKPVGSPLGKRAWGVVTKIRPPSSDPLDRSLSISYPFIGHGGEAELSDLGTFGFNEIEKQ
ncbi:MAG: hypothetical protein WEA04_04970 [Candidatus Andersenbacteria bacterium]